MCVGGEYGLCECVLRGDLDCVDVCWAKIWIV